mmetsp:Transcript_17002/g.55772  ORF Transcript_17002/g.55772 Transcript_17002/m.55772 type:complete len:284 (+) Transcript_17002:511-1362(+)
MPTFSLPPRLCTTLSIRFWLSGVRAHSLCPRFSSLSVTFASIASANASPESSVYRSPLMWNVSSIVLRPSAFPIRAPPSSLTHPPWQLVYHMPSFWRPVFFSMALAQATTLWPTTPSWEDSSSELAYRPRLRSVVFFSSAFASLMPPAAPSLMPGISSSASVVFFSTMAASSSATRSPKFSVRWPATCKVLMVVHAAIAVKSALPCWTSISIAPSWCPQSKRTSVTCGQRWRRATTSLLTARVSGSEGDFNRSTTRSKTSSFVHLLNSAMASACVRRSLAASG